MLATGNDKSVVAACAAVGVLATDKLCLDTIRRGPSSLTPAIVSHARGHPAEHVAIAASAALCALGSDNDGDVFHGLGFTSNEADSFDPTFRAWLMRKGFSDRMQYDGLQGSPAIRAASWAERHPVVLPALAGRDIVTPMGAWEDGDAMEFNAEVSVSDDAALEGGMGPDAVKFSTQGGSDAGIALPSNLYGNDGIARGLHKDFSPDGIRLSSPTPCSPPTPTPVILAPLPSREFRGRAARRHYGPGMPIDGALPPKPAHF
jgi:hypothetical protein